jgi:hypothetical protein
MPRSFLALYAKISIHLVRTPEVTANIEVPTNTQLS